MDLQPFYSFSKNIAAWYEICLLKPKSITKEGFELNNEVNGKPTD